MGKITVSLRTKITSCHIKQADMIVLLLFSSYADSFSRRSTAVAAVTLYVGLSEVDVWTIREFCPLEGISVSLIPWYTGESYLYVAHTCSLEKFRLFTSDCPYTDSVIHSGFPKFIVCLSIFNQLKFSHYMKEREDKYSTRALISNPLDTENRVSATVVGFYYWIHKFAQIFAIMIFENMDNWLDNSYKNMCLWLKLGYMIFFTILWQKSNLLTVV